MKTVTQFNSIVLKTAKQHLSQHAPKKDADKSAKPAAEPTPMADAASSDDATPADAAAQASPADDAASVSDSDEVADEAAASDGPSADAAVLMEQMHIDDKRAARLVDALGLVSKTIDRVRQVTVVEIEGAPARATKVGEFAYLVDMVPSAGGNRDRESGRGGGRGGKPRGRGGQGLMEQTKKRTPRI